MVIDSQEVGKKGRSFVPFTQFPPIVTSCITIVQILNSENCISTIDKAYWIYPVLHAFI